MREGAVTSSPRVIGETPIDASALAFKGGPPSYSPPPRTSDRTPTPKASPPTRSRPEPDNLNTSSNDDNDDDDDNDGEGLPYLKGKSRDTPADSDPDADPSITTRPLGSSIQSLLSPTAASFAVLSYDDSYIDEDEAFARKLAEEEESAYRESQRNGVHSNESNLSRNTSVASSTAPNAEYDLPTYTDAVSAANLDTKSSARVPEVKVEVAPSTPTENGNLARNLSVNSATSVASEPGPPIASSSKVPFPGDGPQAVTSLHPGEPQRVIGRTSSMSALPSADRLRVDDLPTLPAEAEDSPITPTANPSSATFKSKAIEQASGSGSLGMLNATHVVDAELLYGVCKFNAFLVIFRGQKIDGIQL